MASKDGDKQKDSDKRALASKRDETDDAIGHYSWEQIAAANHATGGAEADDGD